MRKIEAEMIRAINERRDWCSNSHKGKTCVEVSEHAGNPYLIATVYLHGHLIAEIVPPEGSRLEDHKGESWEAVPDERTFARWPTTTTVSRLRALGVNAHREAFRPHIDGKPVTA